MTDTGNQSGPLWPGEGVWELLLLGRFSPAPREIPGCSGSTIQVEATAKDRYYPNIGSHSGLPNKYLGGVTSQCQTSHHPLKYNRMATGFQCYPSHISGIIGLVLFSHFSIPNIGVPDVQMFITRGESHEMVPSVSTATHGPNGGISRTLLVSNLTDCLCGLIDRKRTPMPNVMDSVSHWPGVR